MTRLLTVPLLFVLAAGLLGASLSPEFVSAQGEPPPPSAPEGFPGHLPQDGLFDAPHLPSEAITLDVPQAAQAPQYASWSKLIFQSARNQRDWEVYSASGDGGNQVDLSNNSAADLHPRLNRGATRVVFASNRRGNYDIYGMNADGTGQTRLTTSSTDDVSPVWSRDGSRIVFQAYRNGQAEIYVMNADGSGQTRLTNHSDYDGQPAWSPDGTQIAFVRRVSGKNRIWVMNADGSNPHQLSNQASSENPAWSPDGSQIAYDADDNGDSWQEIWLMDAAGGNQRQVYDPPEPDTDAWVRSWSPDGRYIAFTRIAWTYYQNEWYWTTAYLDAWDIVGGNVVRLSSSGADWNPDWQSGDLEAPTSSVLPLPARSPATFAVRWSGTDTGPAGLASYDVQVKDGQGGAWTDWLMQSIHVESSQYTGIGGHTYYFRSRARDYAGNSEVWPTDHDAFTTVESLPPLTAIWPLPDYTRGQNILVHWSGTDPGDSGIQSYDVQVRQAAGPWTDWRIGTTETSATFSGESGAEYGFRVRGTDNAQNVESWSTANSDASTTLYAWAIAGDVTDNRGAPVAGMTVTTAPAASHTAPSDVDGAYSAYVAAQADNYAVNWSRPAYGTLPGTAFPSVQDARVDVVMPPADNVVQNWDFESGSDAWQFDGNLNATITNTSQHSGLSAAFLGSTAGPLSLVTTLPDPPEQGRYPLADSTLDAGGVVHVIWVGPGPRILYSSKSPAGPWTIPEPLPGPTTLWGPLPGLDVDSAGTVHVAWWALTDTLSLFYSQKRAGAGWSAPEVVPTVPGYIVARPRLTVDASGVLKMVWDGPHYSQRDTSGHWTAPHNIADPYPCSDCEIKIATDPAGLVHVLWFGFGKDAFYTAETGDGSWLPAVKLSQSGIDMNNADMVIDAQGAVHVVWGAGGVYYRMRPSGGTWSPQEQVASAVRALTSIAVDGSGGVHLAWGDLVSWDSGKVLYTMRTGAGWSAPVEIAPPAVSSLIQWDWERPKLAIDNHHTVHVLWLDNHLHDGHAFYGVRYATRDDRGPWSPPVDIYHHAGGEPFRDSQLLLDRSGAPHALWAATVAGNTWPVWYAGAEPTRTAGESTLSQAVVVPDAPLAPTLSFLHRFGTEFPSDSRLEVAVDDGSSPTTVFSTDAGVNTWQHAWADLTPWASRSVTLRFRVSEPAGASHAWAYIDEVTVGSAHPDTWVHLSGRRSAPPGGQLVQDITYGNRGGVSASGGYLTLQLPPELIFLSADPPPSTTAPELRWNVGDLAGQSEPQSIRVTLQVAPSAATGTTVPATASIASDTAEIEQANNSAQAATFVGYMSSLPLVERW